MKVSTDRLRSLIQNNNNVFSSGTLNSLKALLDTTPKVNLLEVLARFKSTLYKDELSATGKKVVLGNIIKEFLGITHQDIINAYELLKLNEESLKNWITFCYYIKHESKRFLAQKISINRSQEIIETLPKLNYLLEVLSGSGYLTDENIKWIVDFLVVSRNSLKAIKNKSLEEIKEIQESVVWLYYFGGTDVFNDETISKISARHSSLPPQAHFSIRSVLFNDSFPLADEKYFEMVNFIEEVKQDPLYLKSPKDIGLFKTAIILQKVNCLSVLKKCLQIKVLNDLISISHLLIINENFAQLSNENLLFLIQYLRQSFDAHPSFNRKVNLCHYEIFIDPIQKEQIDLASIPYEVMNAPLHNPLHLTPSQILKTATAQNVVNYLARLQGEIWLRQHSIPNTDNIDYIDKILCRNNLITQFFPAYSHAAVIEAIELTIRMHNTSLFVSCLLLTEEKLDAYLYEFSSGIFSSQYDLNQKLLSLKERGMLHPMALRKIAEKEFPQVSITTWELTHFKGSNSRIKSLITNHKDDWEDLIPLDKQYLFFQCLEKIDGDTQVSIKNTLEFLRVYGYSIPSFPQAVHLVIEQLESCVSSQSKTIIFTTNDQSLDLVLLKTLVDLFTEKRGTLQDSYNKIIQFESSEICFKEIHQKAIQNSPKLYVSSADIKKFFPPLIVKNMSGTLFVLAQELDKNPSISLLSVLRWFREILTIEKELTSISPKWDVLESILENFLGISHEILRNQLRYIPEHYVDDWLRICYLTKGINNRGEILKPLLISEGEGDYLLTENNLSIIYEILRTLSSNNIRDAEDLQWLVSALNKTGKYIQEDMKDSSPAFIINYLGVSFNRGKYDDEQPIEARYEDLPNVSLRNKKGLLQIDEESYQQWKMIKESPNYPILTNKEENKCLEIYLHLENIDCPDLFTQCLRIQYLKEFIIAFNVEDITADFGTFSDLNLACFIIYYLTHTYNSADGLTKIKGPELDADWNVIFNSRDRDLISSQRAVLKNQPHPHREENLKGLEDFINSNISLSLQHYLIKIEEKLANESCAYNKVVLNILRNNLIQGHACIYGYEHILTSAAITKSLSNKKLTNSIFMIHLLLASVGLQESLKKWSIETLIVHHKVILPHLSKLFWCKELDLKKIEDFLLTLKAPESLSNKQKSDCDTLLLNLRGGPIKKPELKHAAPALKTKGLFSSSERAVSNRTEENLEDLLFNL